MPRPGPAEIALALADALPRNAERRAEIVAVGMLATSLIAGTKPDGRAELVETFCRVLRSGVALEMN